MSMQCKEIHADLVAFVDGELAGSRADEVRSHLAACPACAVEAEAHRSVWAALGAIDVDAPTESGWLDRIEAQILETRAAPVLPWRWLAAAAVLALVAGLALGTGLVPDQAPVAVSPSGPAPDATPTRVESPTARPSPRASSSPAPDPSSSPVSWPDEPGLARNDPYQGLSPEEIEVVENLDLLVYLEDEADADLLDNLDLLEDLDEDELEGVG